MTFEVEVINDEGRIDAYAEKYQPACPKCGSVNKVKIDRNKIQFYNNVIGKHILQAFWNCGNCKHHFKQLPLIGQNVKCDNLKDTINIFGVDFSGESFRKLLIKSQ